jgi:hypothetical protein
LDTADTSLEAYAAIRPVAPNMRDRIYDMIKDAPHGMTGYEVQQEGGFLNQTSSARLRELYLTGRISYSGDRRPTGSGSMARVWHAAR